ncbi:ArdC family protein [Alterisphingorhabdus coralli]|uniref:Zincin-like metallopeptidase domain-containing protein n=1 Tax=Alterisphingorhabdus coralli TaxID=3071408 RepID=A0AA97F9N8_9SPHN|nr:zincin-like metallopeptidase domain-containing protein [Parasphingorhabdus sp. SCSIO 66989]WOE76721.1 zincin-like metallopeptidase domain-containing protein [Parasphingorhabdus sp. SCSIO 66989]
MSGKFDIYQTITDSIIAMMEEATGNCPLPWHRQGLTMPLNVESTNRYNGINVVMLWYYGQQCSQQLWGTYRQWANQGAQVKKGAKGVPIIFYKKVKRTEPNGAESFYPMAKASWVFNVDQVTGYEGEGIAPASPLPDTIGQADILDHAEAFIARTGAAIQHNDTFGLDRAFYNYADDYINMPCRHLFYGDQQQAREGYYAILLHELTHWTGHKARCNRGLFGKDKMDYAREELVAEFGAAFLSAQLNITQHPRSDHAEYLKSWIAILKNDKKALFRASKLAGEAVDYLTSLQSEERKAA